MSWGVIHNNEPDIDAACCVFGGNSDFVAKTDDIVNLKSIEATNTRQLEEEEIEERLFWSLTL